MEVTVRFDLKDEKQFDVFGEFLKLLTKAGFKAIGNTATVAIPAATRDSEE